jgi:thiol-disulfide isomerase/thioredoxin
VVSKSRCLILASAVLVVACARSAPLAKPSTLPDRVVLDLRGDARWLGELRGRVTVLDLWATWCKACEAQFPKLERLSRAYATHGLVVIGVNVGEEAPVVSEYASRHAIGYPVYLDPEFRFADALGERNLPAILVVAASGEIAYRSQALDAEALRRIRGLLGVD